MPARMHQTTVRFSEDLWEQLEREAARAGVSAAQFVRDATLARLAYSAGQRGEAPFGEEANPKLEGRVRESGDKSEARQAEAGAVWAQARLARERARTIRDDSRALHARHARERAEAVEGRPTER